MSFDRTTAEDRIETRIQTTLEQIESDLTALVKAFVAPLFEVFDFFVISDNVLTELVDEFVDRVKKRG